jgi:excisionase family DNA binding protein
VKTCEKERRNLPQIRGDVMQDIESDVNRSESLTLTIPETAQLLGISVSKTYEAARLGQLPTIKVGTRVLVSRRRLQEFIDGSTA